MGPQEFENKQEVRDYFTLANCRLMFPGDRIDRAEMERARDACLAHH